MARYGVLASPSFEHQARVAPVVPGVQERPDGLQRLRRHRRAALSMATMTEQTEEEEPFKGPEV